MQQGYKSCQSSQLSNVWQHSGSAHTSAAKVQFCKQQLQVQPCGAHTHARTHVLCSVLQYLLVLEKQLKKAFAAFIVLSLPSDLHSNLACSIVRHHAASTCQPQSTCTVIIQHQSQDKLVHSSCGQQGNCCSRYCLCSSDKYSKEHVTQHIGYSMATHSMPWHPPSFGTLQLTSAQLSSSAVLFCLSVHQPSIQNTSSSTVCLNLRWHI